MRIVLSFFPAQMFSRRRAGRRLPWRAVSRRAFARLKTDVHQARLKCFIGCSALAAFRGFFLAGGLSLLAGIIILIESGSARVAAAMIAGLSRPGYDIGNEADAADECEKCAKAG